MDWRSMLILHVESKVSVEVAAGDAVSQVVEATEVTVTVAVEARAFAETSIAAVCGHMTGKLGL